MHLGKGPTNIFKVTLLVCRLDISKIEISGMHKDCTKYLFLLSHVTNPKSLSIVNINLNAKQ